MTLALAALAAWPACALADATARFIHAVPGAGPGELGVVGAGSVGSASFGEASDPESLASGPVRLELEDARGTTLATDSVRLRDGRLHTIAALADAGGVELQAYPAALPTEGAALLRFIHASPELGEPDLRVDGRVVVRGARFKQATGYVELEPGAHDLAALRPGGGVLVSGKDVELAAGRSYSAVVVGTRGERTRIVLVSEDRVKRSNEASTGGADDGRDRRARAPNQGAGDQETWTVRPGDSLWSIAEQQLEPGASDTEIWRRMRLLWATNKSTIGTGDPDLIHPGQRLRSPA